MSSQQQPTPATATTGAEQADSHVTWKECSTCRYTGAATFSGIGAYAIYTAHEQGAFARVRPPGSPLVAGKVTAAIGVVFLGLGIGRLFIK
ncbi:uncharacterized protein EHS24_002398 [Apiotrichum porosum]|uniref:Distal membrane-arm assembly complex protein 1-like domain-containing protein n=1 Tax=Apiotrichum porosum TaxID=105984 RepID=A0A427XID5_9TREE|nr:uncharacterized protein EHS24_002398 [Apiotrichum porosum]RSH78669.1 hypothetical protein EHS24_002398 [Apiotrichum porosum]